MTARWQSRMTAPPSYGRLLAVIVGEWDEVAKVVLLLLLLLRRSSSLLRLLLLLLHHHLLPGVNDGCIRVGARSRRACLAAWACRPCTRAAGACCMSRCWRGSPPRRTAPVLYYVLHACTLYFYLYFLSAPSTVTLHTLRLLPPEGPEDGAGATAPYAKDSAIESNKMRLL